MQLVRWETGTEPHTEADVARTMSATLVYTRQALRHLVEVAGSDKVVLAAG